VQNILQVQKLSVYYKSVLGDYRVVEDASFEVRRNEIFGIAGESGCGKSTLVEGILRLVRPPGYIPNGKVMFENVDLLKLSEDQLRDIRWKRLSYVPQGSMNSLNPVLRIEEQITDGVTAHLKIANDGVVEALRSSLNNVGLPEEVARMYAHELSGGMKQRVVIAMATMLNPDLVVADEPVTALDVASSRINLQTIAKLKQKLNMAVIIVAHDMAVHAEITDRIAIMYAGKIVEIGPTPEVFEDPLHPYTKGLLKAVLSIEKRQAESIPGLAPSPLNWPSGCRFHPRCPYAMKTCEGIEPELEEIEPGRFVACHLYG